MIWNKFWDWYEKQLKGSLVFLLIIHIIQIPHMLWVGDVYLRAGLISNINPIFDFLLYGVDLIELLSLATVISLIYTHGIRHRLK